MWLWADESGAVIREGMWFCSMLWIRPNLGSVTPAAPAPPQPPTTTNPGFRRPVLSQEGATSERSFLQRVTDRRTRTRNDGTAGGGGEREALEQHTGSETEERVFCQGPFRIK